MIKQIGIPLLIATTLSSSLLANENGTENKMTIGLEAGYSEIQAHNIFSPIIGQLDYKGDDVEYGFRLGLENSKWKTIFAINFYDSPEDDQQYTKGLIEMDYFIVQDSALKPYIGLNVGYLNYKSSNIDENGALYGGQIGLQYDAMERISFDLGYRYSYASSDNVEYIAGIIFGINYEF